MAENLENIEAHKFRAGRKAKRGRGRRKRANDAAASISSSTEKIAVNSSETSAVRTEGSTLAEKSQVSSTSDENISRGETGSPIVELSGSGEDKYHGNSIVEDLRPTWRSQLHNIVYFILCSVLCVWLSQDYLSWSVVSNTVLKLFGVKTKFYLPLLTLVPGYFLGRILLTIYDSRYIIDSKGVEAQMGLVSMSLRQPRLRFEDIRGVEPNQTLVQRILGIGDLLVGSAMTFEVEIIMEGIANPRGVQQLINRERDKHLRSLGKQGTSKLSAISGD